MLGLNFAQIESLLQNRRLLLDYIHALYEIGADTIRIPFYWRRLIEYSDRIGHPEFRPNARLIDQYHQFVDQLPEGIRVLGCVVNGSPFVAARYCYDQTVLPDFYREYLQFLLRSFPFIYDMELWNEPNASDFYFSIINKDGTHRPWNGLEFVRDVVIPGSLLLRESGLRGQIVGATFAENGLIGHGQRKPAFANILKGIPAFQAYAEENSRIGSFYFKANFAREVLASFTIIPKRSEKLPFDVFGLHPYPYFQARGVEYWKHSVQLINDFYELLDTSELSSVPVWATEVGIRSLDLHNGYSYDADQQKSFIHLFAKWAQFGTRLSRIYWYKYNDQNWDLIQEKTFGLFDHFNNKKPAFYSLKSLLSTVVHRQGKPVLTDDFLYGVVHTRGAIDPEFWKLSKNTEFAYMVCGRSLADSANRERARLLVYPGRNVNDWLKLETLDYLISNSRPEVNVDVGFQLFAETIKSKAIFQVRIGFTAFEEQEGSLGVCITLDLDQERVTCFLFSTEGRQGDIVVFQDHDLGKILGLRVSIRADNMTVQLYGFENDGLAQFTLMEQAMELIKGPLRVFVEIRRTFGPRGFVELTDFRAYRDTLKLPTIWD